ncbi:MAG: hypothetical protein SFU86_03950 [Pirellulaceae bacterium]|nr:hypothetical protein [Pirellulaceae bacterium]
MKRKNRLLNQQNDRLSSWRAAAGDEDGLDPRDYFQKENATPHSSRKSEQLCAQVADTLCRLFGGECGDEVLQALQVLDVAAAPDASQLVVLVGPVTDDLQLDPAEVAAALDRAAGWLRTEVAAAITRKRAPRLVFRYVPVVPGEEARR